MDSILKFFKQKFAAAVILAVAVTGCNPSDTTNKAGEGCRLQ